ncbi:MAG: type II toxin-antitoxin system VapC family toxin [Candidatus Nanopelagicales bacterium]|nr:type II toxin-antitoxin system VapC family toxin [Candidatus Nanopelagicales bacterium]
MRYLLDTHLLLWVADDSPRLPIAVRQIVLSPENELWFSAASIWEIVVKHRLGKLDVDARVLRGELVSKEYRPMDITPDDAIEVSSLEGGAHKDPFDRMLIAQSRTRRMTFLTSDQRLAEAYPDAPVELHLHQ